MHRTSPHSATRLLASASTLRLCSSTTGLPERTGTGRLLFNVLGMVAEFEADLIRARTREGMAVARAKGRLRGKKPKLSPAQEAHLVNLHRQGTHTSAEIAELFGVARSTVYRALERAGALKDDR